MLADIEKSRGFVISAVIGDFGEEIESLYDIAVYVEAPFEIRIKRLEQRAYERHGERIRKGGDMYKQHLMFVDFVASRPLTRIEQWAETLTCLIIRIDGTEDWRVNAEYVAEQYSKGLESAV